MQIDNVFRVLYLDFDGVLHPFGEPALGDDFGLLPNPNLFRWLPILESLLSGHPDVRIIVSSDWHRLFDDATLKRLLGPVGGRFHGVIEAVGKSRASEILADAKKRGLKDWIAIDDHPTVRDASLSDCRFVACDPATGIGDPGVQWVLSVILSSSRCIVLLSESQYTDCQSTNSSLVS